MFEALEGVLGVPWVVLSAIFSFLLMLLLGWRVRAGIAGANGGGGGGGGEGMEPRPRER